jgi:hypothetical protein
MDDILVGNLYMSRAKSFLVFKTFDKAYVGWAVYIRWTVLSLTGTTSHYYNISGVERMPRVPKSIWYPNWSARQTYSSFQESGVFTVLDPGEVFQVVEKNGTCVKIFSADKTFGWICLKQPEEFGKEPYAPNGHWRWILRVLEDSKTQ